MLENCTVDISEKKKRGRKKKEPVEVVPTIQTSEQIQFTIEETAGLNEDSPTGKKRGRKPRGGKLVLKQQETSQQPATLSNVILHLKCSLSDLNEYNNRITNLMTDPLAYKPDLPTQILTYNEVDGIFNKYTSDIHPSSFESEGQHANEQTFRPLELEPTQTLIDTKMRLCGCENMCIESKNICFDDPEVDNVNIKDVNQKLKHYKIQLYKNAMQYDKKSACFWCTYDYDNPPCYIPKYEMEDMIYGYGSFCRPECAAAYLMEENLDDSTKFERYHLLNQIYGKVYGCKKNIKPAPNPYYLLDKFYGNLSIQEYRKLLKTEHLLLVLDKPFTRILPELHEDNDELITNIYGVTKQNNQVSGVYKVKRQSEKQQGPSKASIIRNKFGLE
jgi:hypothetical protein